MPKHFTNAPVGKHFSLDQAEAQEESSPVTGAGVPTTEGAEEPEGREAPSAQETTARPDERPTTAIDPRALPELRAVPDPRQVPDPQATPDAGDPGATRPMGPQELAPETSQPEPADNPPTAAEPPRPHEATPSADDVDQDLEPLGRHDIAAVQSDGTPYLASDPSPYLSRRQARKDPQKAKHRHLVLIVVVLVVAATGVVGAGAYVIHQVLNPPVETTDVQYETAKITRGNFVDSIDATSTLSPLSTQDVVPQVTGTIKSVDVEEGATVARGDTLFTLDNAEITAAVTSAKAQLDAAQADLDVQQQRLDQDSERLSQLQETLAQSAATIYSITGMTPGTATFNVDTNGDGTPDAYDADGNGTADGFDTNGDGILDMVDTNGDGTPDTFDADGDGKVDSTTTASTDASATDATATTTTTLTPEQQSQLQAAESTYLSTQAQISSAQSTVTADNAQVSAAQETVDSMQEAYDRAASQQRKLTVTAPISGTVHEVSSSLVEGGTLSTTGKMCQIDDESEFVFTIQADESEARKAQVGQDVQLTFPDHPNLQQTGSITAIATAKTDGADTVAVDITLSDPDEQLESGATVEAQAVVQEIDDVLIVPTSSLHTVGRDSYLDILLDPLRGIETEVRVDVVASNDDEAVVEADNIQEGNAVILSRSEG